MSLNHNMKMQRGFHNTGKPSLQQRVAGYLKKPDGSENKPVTSTNLPGFMGIIP